MHTNFQDDLWARRFHPAPDAGTILVCLPHAGGSATYYFPISRALSPRFEVLAIQYPGRQDRRTERCLDSVEELADGVVRAILPWTDRPVALFGHSLGASLGFEVALRLEAEGVIPRALFVSSRRAPSQHRDEQVHLRDDNGLITEIKALSGTNARLLGDDEVLRMILPSIRADYKAAETYEYPPDGKRLTCAVHALIGDSDPKATINDAKGWAEHTNGEFTITVFPGGHFYLNSATAEVLDLVAQRLSPARP